MIARMIRLAGAISILTIIASFVGSARLVEAGSQTAYADGDGVRACAGLVPCYLTIQDAVNHVAGPTDATVLVFPGIYNESVNLNNMASASSHTFGNLSLETVDAAGAPSPGTATIHGAAAISTTTQGFPNNLTLDGFIAESSQKDGVYLNTAGSIVIRNMTANNPGDGSSSDNTGDDGFDLTTTAGGSVTIEGSTAEHAHGNLGDGFQIATTGGAAIRNTTASNNIGTQDNFGINMPDSHGDVVLDNVTADGNSEGGIYVYTTGSVTLSGEANDNGFRGADIFTEFGTPASIGNPVPQQTGAAITVDGFIANGNGDDGILAQAFPDIDVRNTQANSNHYRGLELLSQEHVGVTNTDVESDQDLGTYIEANSDVAIDRVSAINNGAGGLKIVGFGNPLGSVSVHDSLVNHNTGQGIDIFNLKSGGTNDIDSNVICGNSGGGLRNNGTSLTIPAAGNWWGSASGPKAVGNPSGTGDQINNGGDGTFVYAPWVTHVEATEPSAATGVPSPIVFTFPDDARTVKLQNNPGDNLAQAPFAISTDNGSLEAQAGSGTSVHGYIANGELDVTLTPTHTGEANVTLTGPCGLTHQLAIQVGVGNPPVDRIWGDNDCGGDIGPRDAQGILKNVLVQTPLSQTEPCPDVGSQVTVDGVSRIWGDTDCGGDIGPRDAQGILKNVLVQTPLSQTEPCPAVGSTVQVVG
jgi:Right handed beta helix region